MGRIGFVVVLTLLFNTALYAKESTYKIYFPWESDSMLVAWAIHTYVDSKAKFVSVDKKKETIPKEIAINTSNSSLRRTAKYTAFEMGLKHFKIEKKGCLNELTKVIRVVEMTPWRKHKYLRALKFEEDLVPTFPNQVGKSELQKSFAVIDGFCKEHP